MHTPTSPVNLAWAQAMNAAISSWRTCDELRSAPRRSNALKAPMIPLIPSPGYP